MVRRGSDLLRLHLRGPDWQRANLEIHAEPANLVVSPWGDLLLAEDGPEEQYLVGVMPDGTIYKFGRNAFSQSEFAGLTFAPDGTALFVNIQHSGLTLAIFGPWARARPSG